MKSLMEISKSLFISGIAVLSATSASAIGKEYVEHLALGRFDEIYYHETDLDGDNHKEIWISPKLWTNGVAGNSWFVFAQKDGRYEQLETLPVVRNDAFMRATLNGTEIVLNRWRGGAGESSIIGYWFENGDIVEKKIGEVSRDDPEDSPLKLLLSSSITDQIEALPPRIVEANLMTLDSSLNPGTDENGEEIVSEIYSENSMPMFVSEEDGTTEADVSKVEEIHDTELPGETESNWIIWLGTVVIAVFLALVFARWLLQKIRA